MAQGWEAESNLSGSDARADLICLPGDAGTSPELRLIQAETGRGVSSLAMGLSLLVSLLMN